MSSATQAKPGAGTSVLAATAGQVGTPDKVARLGMSPRQQALNLLWARYCAQQYEARKYDWYGREVLSPLDKEAVASGNAIPPGFYDAGGQMTPLSVRKPTAPYHLGRVIVNRFTGLLFSARHHPQLRVAGDHQTEDFVRTLADVSRIWAHMITARTFGGATGDACVGFQFVDGLPRIEVHDPRWVIPEFADQDRLILKSIDKRHMAPQDEPDPENGGWKVVWYWHRRQITQQSDTVFKPVLVGQGEEPQWEVLRTVEHGFGFCPVVWIQNSPVVGEIDGDPDCVGIYDTLDAIDALLAQANLGTMSNSDPTLLLSTDKPLAEIRKGSDNAIKLPMGGEAKYIELTGSGPKAARELAADFRAQALEVAQCVLDQPNQAAAVTATEIERRYSSMIERADIFREQYGERGVKPLLEMMVKAARMLSEPRLDQATGKPITQFLRLPQRVTTDPNDPTKVARADRKLGPGGNLELEWPSYFLPSADDASKIVTTAVTAKAASLVDAEAASTLVAPIFGVQDVPAMLRKIEAAAVEQQAALEQMALKGVSGVALGVAAKAGAGAHTRDDVPEDDGQPVEDDGSGQPQPDQAPPPVRNRPPDAGQDDEG